MSRPVDPRAGQLGSRTEVAETPKPGAELAFAREAGGALVPAGRAADSYGDLSPFLVEVAEAAGLDAAVQLARGYGGTEIFVPREAPPGHWLAACVGVAAAAKICRHFATHDADGRPIAFRVYVPLAGAAVMPRTLAALARAMVEEQIGLREAVRRFGVSERTVKRLRAKLRDDRQLRLL